MRQLAVGILGAALLTGCGSNQPDTDATPPTAPPSVVAPDGPSSPAPAPAEVPSDEVPNEAGASTTTERQQMESRDVTVGEHALPGAIVLPEGDANTAVVLLAGSGPQDLDGTIGASRNPFLKDIAEGLAERGIASIRFTKVTKHAPEAVEMKSLTLDDEYFNDAAAAIKLLQEQPELKEAKLFVVGHSQGAMVMPEVLNRNTELAGGVSLAGTPRSLFDVIHDQNMKALEAQEDLPEEKRTQQLELAKETTELAKKIDDPSDEVPLLLAKSMSSSYIASLNNLDAASTAAQLGVPMLFLQGEADRQVFYDVDYREWQELLADKENATFESYSNLSHLFGKSVGIAAMDDINSVERVNPQVIDDMAEWLLQHS